MHLPCLVHHPRGKCPPIFTQMLPLLSLPELKLSHFVFVFLEPTFLEHHILIDPCDVHLLDKLLYFTSVLLLICYLCVGCYQARSALTQSALPECYHLSKKKIQSRCSGFAELRTLRIYPRTSQHKPLGLHTKHHSK